MEVDLCQPRFVHPRPISQKYFILTYVCVHSGFTRRIVGLPKAESDAILKLLFQQLSENPDYQVRFHWEPNSIAMWDNRVRTSAVQYHRNAVTGLTLMNAISSLRAPWLVPCSVCCCMLCTDAYRS